MEKELVSPLCIYQHQEQARRKQSAMSPSCLLFFVLEAMRTLLLRNRKVPYAFPRRRETPSGEEERRLPVRKREAFP